MQLAGATVKTTSLLLRYVKNHRSEIPQAELDKLRAGMAYLAKHGDDQPPAIKSIPGKLAAQRAPAQAPLKSSLP